MESGRLLRNITSASSRGKARPAKYFPLNSAQAAMSLNRTCTGKDPNNDSVRTEWRVADRHLSSLTRSLPCSVAEKYQLNQRVCKINQAILGYAGDPQSVVQNVQVHAVGFFGFFFRPRRISALAVRYNVTKLGLGDEEHCRRLEEPRPAAIGSPGGKNIRPTQSESSPPELLFIQIKGQSHRWHTPSS